MSNSTQYKGNPNIPNQNPNQNPSQNPNDPNKRGQGGHVGQKPNDPSKQR